MSDRRTMEREIDLLRERLEASQRSLDATRGELDLRESRLSSLDEEFRSHSLNVRSAHSQFCNFKEQLCSLLSTPDQVLEMSEDNIKLRITEIVHRNREMMCVSIGFKRIA